MQITINIIIPILFKCDFIMFAFINLGDDMVGRKLVLFYCSRLPPGKQYDQGRLLLWVLYAI